MSDQVNVLAVAQRILDVPGGLEAGTRRGVVALAGLVGQDNLDARQLRRHFPGAPAPSAYNSPSDPHAIHD